MSMFELFCARLVWRSGSGGFFAGCQKADYLVLPFLKLKHRFSNLTPFIREGLECHRRPHNGRGPVSLARASVSLNPAVRVP